jgi:hypothetical protein
MLYGTSLSGEMLVDWLDKRFLKGTPRYTIFGNNNGSFVFQSANMLRKLGQLNGLNPKVKIRRGDILTLRDNLRLGNVLSLISVTYFKDKEPVIALGKSTSNSLGAVRLAGGHLMALGAFDPHHQNEAGNLTPWGFLSSWPGKDHLYWVSDGDFKRSWGKLSLFNMVTVTRDLKQDSL